MSHFLSISLCSYLIKNKPKLVVDRNKRNGVGGRLWREFDCDIQTYDTDDSKEL
jgi:hypothetical protein